MMRFIGLASLWAGTAFANDIITIQSTTSTQNAGFYDAILPMFTAQSGWDTRVIAVGTGQAIKNTTRCDGDILIAHAKAAERDFVDAGYGIARFDLMYNDFVLVGPADDPAKIQTTSSARDALTQIAAKRSIFVSRADNSGTHSKEMSLWEDAGYDPVADSGTWYRETGSGMGATLNTAIAMSAYTLVDRATWISFANTRNHRILLQSDPDLFNQYGVTIVHPDHCPNSNQAGAAALQNWLLSEDGQRAIAQVRLNAQQLFTPNAR